MTKISPGARLGMAEAIAGEVLLIPIKKRDWNKVTLKFKNHIFGWKEELNIFYNYFNNGCTIYTITSSSLMLMT